MRKISEERSDLTGICAPWQFKKAAKPKIFPAVPERRHKRRGGLPANGVSQGKINRRKRS